MQTFIQNDQGGITYATPQRIGDAEQRSSILADLRMTIDALSDSGEAHQQARTNIAKLMGMLPKTEAADALRAELSADLEKIDAITNFNSYIVSRVRGGHWHKFAELFDR